MKQKKKILIVLIPIIILILLVLIITSVVKNKHEEIDIEKGKNLSLTKNEEDFVTIEYFDSNELQNMVEPLKEARFVKAFEEFLTVDVQKALDMNATASESFDLSYKKNTAANFGNAFLISDQSIDALLEKLRPYKSKIGTAVKSVKFDYDESQKICNIKMLMEDGQTINGKIIEGLTLLEVEF